MKNDQTQNIMFWALLVLVIWLMFFRKTEKYCGACAAAMAA
jgi:hypothetical protein